MGELIDVDGLSAYLVAGGSAGVVVLHEWWGLVPQIKRLCESLGASAGCTVLAPDLYRGATAPYDRPDRAQSLMAGLDRDRAISETMGCVAELRRRGCARVGTMGFCLGGALSLAASARCRVDATVSYYGIWPEEGERSITTPILAHVAQHEEHNPPADPDHFPRWFQGMDNARICIYPGTQHAFANDARPDVYDQPAAMRAWDCTLAFFKAHLDPAAGGRRG